MDLFIALIMVMVNGRIFMSKLIIYQVVYIKQLQYFCMSIIPLLKIIKNKKIKMSYTGKFLKAKDEKIEDKW